MAERTSAGDNEARLASSPSTAAAGPTRYVVERIEHARATGGKEQPVAASQHRSIAASARRLSSPFCLLCPYLFRQQLRFPLPVHARTAPHRRSRHVPRASDSSGPSTPRRASRSIPSHPNAREHRSLAAQSSVPPSLLRVRPGPGVFFVATGQSSRTSAPACRPSKVPCCY